MPLQLDKHETGRRRAGLIYMRCSIFVLSALLALPLLAEKYHLNPTPAVPAATGEVDAGKDNNRNTTIDLKVEHLARPANLAPPRQTYVVWVQVPGGSALNLGVLRVDNDLKGEFKSVTSVRNFDLFITAENDPHVMAPHGPVVLRTTVHESGD